MIWEEKKMVPPKLATITTIAISLALLLFIYESEAVSHSSSSAAGEIITPYGDDQKVNVSVYYESLCKSCATFIVRNLNELFNSGLINIVNLHLLPWANASLNLTNNSISCQNGPDECRLNSLEACALNIMPLNMHFGLIYCFEFLAIEGRNSWEDCFDQLDLSKEPIVNCSRGNGTELGKEYINETAKLNPPHSFVPWVVVNNQPIRQDYGNFTYYVCKAYRGVAAPEACNYLL